ncbi:MAG: hypothetical protein ACREXS_11200 [Gammaproteobacteria bacterium]
MTKPEQIQLIKLLRDAEQQCSQAASYLTAGGGGVLTLVRAMTSLDRALAQILLATCHAVTREEYDREARDAVAQATDARVKVHAAVQNTVSDLEGSEAFILAPQPPNQPL